MQIVLLYCEFGWLPWIRFIANLGKEGLTLTARGSTLVLWTSDFDANVCGRQILTPKVDSSTVRVKIFIMVVDPKHRYSNGSERAN